MGIQNLPHRILEFIASLKTENDTIGNNFIIIMCFKCSIKSYNLLQSEEKTHKWIISWTEIKVCSNPRQNHQTLPTSGSTVDRGLNPFKPKSIIIRGLKCLFYLYFVHFVETYVSGPVHVIQLKISILFQILTIYIQFNFFVYMIEELYTGITYKRSSEHVPCNI